MFSGRILFADQSSLWLSRGKRLFNSLDSGKTWKFAAFLPVSGWRESLVAHPLGERFGRVGFHHLVVLPDNSILIVGHRHLFHMKNHQGHTQIVRVAPINGSRPLALCLTDDFVCYGEYRSNPERNPVSVWGASLNDHLKHWSSILAFQKIRHIHGVFFDSYENCIWLTTGDEDDEAAIWRTRDHFSTLERVVGGSQQMRAVQLLFTADHIYFGSDAPNEHNYIYRLERSAKYIEQLASVGSSVFYGCKVGEYLFFSTAVEPSQVNRSRYAEIWGSFDGSKWQVVNRFRKDWLPMKLFQYGQVLFPSGPGDNDNLWFTPMSTEHSQKSFKIPVTDLGLLR